MGKRVFALAAVLAIVASVAPATSVVPARATSLIFAGELLDEVTPAIDHVELLFEGPIDPFSIPDPQDFDVVAGAATPSVVRVTIPYEIHGGVLSIVRLDLDQSISAGGTFSYTPGAHPLIGDGGPIDPIVDADLTVAFNDLPFDNMFGFVDEGLGPDHALLFAFRRFGAGPTADPGDFAVTITPPVGPPAQVEPSTVNVVERSYGLGLLDLHLPTTVQDGDLVSVRYTPGVHPLLDVAGAAMPELPAIDVGVNVAAVPTRTTPTGTDVSVSPADTRSGTQPVEVTFSSVSSGGSTTLTTDTVGPALPAGLQLGDPPSYFDLATTATFSGPIEICFSYSESAYNSPESGLRMLHFEAGAWVDVTTSLDTVGNVLCGTTTSLSPFAVAVQPPFGFTGFFSPVDNPPVLNSVTAGASVPVKFRLAGSPGAGILAQGSPTSMAIACITSAPVDAIEETTTSTSGLHVESSGQYVYVWKTSAPWAGTCRQLILRLTDGTVHTADFKFR